MLLKSISALLLLASSTSANYLAAGYQQCGGYNHIGPTHCERGYHCERLNDYYYQCLPGHGTRTSSSIPTATRIPSGSIPHGILERQIYATRPARLPRITLSPAQTQTQAAPSRTPSVPRHLMEFARRDGERRERGENALATQSVGEMIVPMYPQPTQTLTAEDIDQINLLDDIEREILRFSRNGGLSPVVI